MHLTHHTGLDDGLEQGWPVQRLDNHHHIMIYSARSVLTEKSVIAGMWVLNRTPILLFFRSRTSATGPEPAPLVHNQQPWSMTNASDPEPAPLVQNQQPWSMTNSPGPWPKSLVYDQRPWSRTSAPESRTNSPGPWPMPLVHDLNPWSMTNSPGPWPMPLVHDLNPWSMTDSPGPDPTALVHDQQPYSMTNTPCPRPMPLVHDQQPWSMTNIPGPWPTSLVHDLEGDEALWTWSWMLSRTLLPQNCPQKSKTFLQNCTFFSSQERPMPLPKWWNSVCCEKSLMSGHCQTETWLATETHRFPVTHKHRINSSRETIMPNWYSLLVRKSWGGGGGGGGVHGCTVSDIPVGIMFWVHPCTYNLLVIHKSVFLKPCKAGETKEAKETLACIIL